MPPKRKTDIKERFSLPTNTLSSVVATSSTSRLSISAPTTSQELEAVRRGRPIALTSDAQRSIRETTRATENDPRRLVSREVRYCNSTGQLQPRHSTRSSQPRSSVSSRLNPPLPAGHRDDSSNKSMLADWSGRARTHELMILGIPYRRRDNGSLIRRVDEEFRSRGQGSGQP